MRDRDRRWGEMLARLKPAERARLLGRLPPDAAREIAHVFESWALDGQLPPKGDWRVWLIMAGRGFGKTRAGAEWVTRMARRTGRTRIALVAATTEEARNVMIEGPSGLLACADPRRRPKWEPSRGKLTFASGAEAFVYSADNPESLRGPQHRYAWCDELAKWRHGPAAWDNLIMGLREGPSQRVVVTTTPRPVPLLKRLLADPATVRTGGRTRDNVHLPEAYIAAVEGSYAGTRLGRQELDGELIEDADGALWTRDAIDAARSDRSEAERTLVRVVIGVDPPASSEGDACGIVACGQARDGTAHVLEDASVDRPSPERWAAAVADAAWRWRADRVVAEANQGGEMVGAVLRQHDRSLPVTLVHASRGKSARAEPVSFLYAQGRVKHAGIFPALEEQMCGMTIGGGYEGPGRSPDRADALVWALTELMLAKRGEPRVLLL